MLHILACLGEFHQKLRSSGWNSVHLSWDRHLKHDFSKKMTNSLDSDLSQAKFLAETKITVLWPFGKRKQVQKMTIYFHLIWSWVSFISAHWTPNFTNSEFQFPQFKVLQCVFLFNIELYWHFWVHFDINSKLLSGKILKK